MSEYHYQISEASRLLAVEAHVLRYWEEELGMIIPRNEMGHRYYTEEHLRIFSQVKDMKERGYQLRAIRAILSGEEVPEPCITEVPLKKAKEHPMEDTKDHRPQPGESAAPKGGQLLQACREREQEKNRKREKEADASSPDPVRDLEIRDEHLESPGKASVNTPQTTQQPVEIPRRREPLHPTEPKTPPESPGPLREVPNRPEGSPENRMKEFQVAMARIVAQAVIRNNQGLVREISQKLQEDLLDELQFMQKAAEERQEERFRRLDEVLRTIQQNNRSSLETAATRSPRLWGKKRRKKWKYRKI